ncbi:hypothetical protein BDV59DRAFT_183543 [Aspergillus ambiguus]|uniref:uncharacterized protein n=1 Tax=Aspergillus ambiguus TaxID=176160 RepID=UPI003CCDC621
MMSTVPQHRKESLLSLPIRTSAYHQDPLVYINRQAKHIQRRLQVLIDAQSDGLLAGLGRPLQDGDRTLSPGRSGTQSSQRSSSHGVATVPVRQPAAEKISLRAAREDIFRSIYDLLKLREEERDILTSRADERRNALGEVDEYNRKRDGLEKAISTIHNNRESQRSKELRAESASLETEIHDMETRLSQMKARHRNVLQKLSQIDNSVESKLSSYKASLSLLESKIQKFLQSPPVEPYPVNPEQTTFYTLNPKRRTLDMAKECWDMEQSGLQERQEEIIAEIQALEEGGGVWKQVVGEVSGFEKRLRATMRQSIERQSQILKADGLSGTQAETGKVREILEDLGNTTARIEYHLEIAEEKDWSLLICCIAAELEALREARTRLLDAFGVSEDEIYPAEKGEQPESHPDAGHEPQSDPLGIDNPEPPEDLLKDPDAHSHDAVSRSDADEEPDPAWLLPEA